MNLRYVGVCQPLQTILKERSFLGSNRPTEKQILELIPKFIGKLEQRPPAYSTIKLMVSDHINLQGKIRS